MKCGGVLIVVKVYSNKIENASTPVQHSSKFFYFSLLITGLDLFLTTGDRQHPFPIRKIMAVIVWKYE